MKKDLNSVSSDLALRVGTLQDVVRSILEGYRKRDDTEVYGLWMTKEDSWEEEQEEAKVKELIDNEDKEFKLFADEKYLVDEYVLLNRRHASHGFC